MPEVSAPHLPAQHDATAATTPPTRYKLGGKITPFLKTCKKTGLCCYESFTLPSLALRGPRFHFYLNNYLLIIPRLKNTIKQTRKDTGTDCPIERTSEKNAIEGAEHEKPMTAFGRREDAQTKPKHIVAEEATAWCGYRRGILRDHKGV